jgi:RNA polymerase sigma-70 factor (ECF subfamily)
MYKKEKSIQILAIEFIEKRDNRSFSELVDRLKPGLLLFSNKFVNDKDICQEIISQTFISVWEKIDQYNNKFSFSTWVYAIAKNEALGQLRLKKKNLSHDRLSENHSKILKLYSTPIYMDLECMIPNGEELTKNLYDLTLMEINNLSEPYKKVMYEREINKKQLQLIAIDLGWNLNTVKTRLRKARQDIANSLTKKYPELIEAYNESN